MVPLVPLLFKIYSILLNDKQHNNPASTELDHGRSVPYTTVDSALFGGFTFFVMGGSGPA
jgi:hypothetical protein